MELLTQIQPVANVTSHVYTHRDFIKKIALLNWPDSMLGRMHCSLEHLFSQTLSVHLERNFLVSPYGH